MKYRGTANNITLPDSYQGGNYAIGKGAFSGCSGLTNVTIPNSVTTIGDHAFAECVKIESVSLGSGLRKIGGKAFHNDNRLCSITCYAAVPPICCESTFYNVSRYTQLFVPAEVLSKYQSAPYWCDFDIQPLND